MWFKLKKDLELDKFSLPFAALFEEGINIPGQIFTAAW